MSVYYITSTVDSEIDGLAFDLSVGSVIEYPEEADTPWTCFLLAESAQECYGNTWPIRLFRVEANDEVGVELCANSITILEELDANLVFGPNGAEVAAFIDTVGGIDDLHLLYTEKIMLAHYDEIHSSWKAVDDALSENKLSIAFSRVTEALYAQTAIAQGKWVRTSVGLDRAALALVLRGMIPKGHYNVLKSPFCYGVGKKLHTEDISVMHL